MSTQEWLHGLRAMFAIFFVASVAFAIYGVVEWYLARSFVFLMLYGVMSVIAVVSEWQFAEMHQALLLRKR